MVDRDVQISPKETFNFADKTILKVKNLTLKHHSIQNKNQLQSISFELKKGEILGVFGLMGAGRTELLEVIFGIHASKSCFEIEIEGKIRKIGTPKDAIQNGLAFVTEDRKSEGLVLGMSIAENISLTVLPEFGILNATNDTIAAQDYIKQLSIKTPSEKQSCINLSGGNQQKVVLAKWLATQPKILLLDEPTRGIDINAKNEIYQLIKKLAENGLSIMLVSSEIPEILALSDRILVMSEGKIKGEFLAADANEDKLLKAAI
jgi:ribose transport system ATP-binding protein